MKIAVSNFYESGFCMLLQQASAYWSSRRYVFADHFPSSSWTILSSVHPRST